MTEPSAITQAVPRTFGFGVRIWAILLFATFCLLTLSLILGGGDVGIGESFRAIFAPDGGLASVVVHDVRLPRSLAAIAAGGLLGLSGCLMQVLLRNPLADPYILGLSGGAAAGAICAMFLRLGSVFVNLGAGAGALISSLLLMGLARREFSGAHATADHGDGSTRLVLTGSMIAAVWGAIITLCLILASERNLRSMIFWMAGDLSGVQSSAPAFITLGVTLAAVAPMLRQFNVLLQGEVTATSLGVHVKRVKFLIFLVASASTAVAVTTAGTVGFIGLVVPHALRMLIGNDQRILVPACAIAGGMLLLAGDIIARCAVYPLQLPVGAIMALIGVPVFLHLLRKQ